MYRITNNLLVRACSSFGHGNGHRLRYTAPLTRSFSSASFTTDTTLPRLRVVMDLDECMGESSFRFKGDLQYKMLDIGNSIGSTFFFRPHLDVFLEGISEFADIYGYTAGMQMYAEPIYNHLNAQKTMFKKVLYQQHLVEHKKDLRQFGDEIFIPERTVLVDNSSYNFRHQPSNGLLVPDFYVSDGNVNDTVLLEALELLRQMSTEPDVRVNMHQKKIPKRT